MFGGAEVKVFLTPKAQKELRKLGEPTQKEIEKKLRQLKENVKIGKHLRHSRFWSLRVREYRAIYEITGNKAIVLFIGHRKRVYSDFSKLL